MVQEDGGSYVCFKLVGAEQSLWYRWITATFYTKNGADWLEIGTKRQKLVGSEPLDSGVSLLLKEKAILDDDIYDEEEDQVEIAVAFTVSRDVFAERNTAVDAKFLVGQHCVFANKAYLGFISPVLSNVFDNEKVEGAEATRTGDLPLEDFLRFLHAVYQHSKSRVVVNGDNFEKLFAVARHFAVQFLLNACKSFALDSNKMPIMDKLLVVQAADDMDLIKTIVGKLRPVDLKSIDQHEKKLKLKKEVLTELLHRALYP
ncbi:hypothetical protein AAVH_10409 [Aphelenchoides avenae]|nr:hypothetical protein AAVH_10409 [Aphelenchus avenae]